ncbi:MAG: preprotein translocase subunit SecG [Chlorobi bacterium]|nr:preprotein translocase subunit SecG [Chlorobiota bacterium]
MKLFIVFLILIVVSAVLLIAVIMVQNPKGGGLDSTFGGGSAMIGGVKQTTDFLEKATWTLFAIMIGLILLSNTIVFKQAEEPVEINVPEEVEQPALPPVQQNAPIGTQGQGQTAPQNTGEEQ